MQNTTKLLFRREYCFVVTGFSEGGGLGGLASSAEQLIHSVPRHQNHYPALEQLVVEVLVMKPVELLLPLCPELVNSHKKGVDYGVKYDGVLRHLLGGRDRLGYPQRDVEQFACILSSQCERSFPGPEHL